MARPPLVLLSSTHPPVAAAGAQSEQSAVSGVAGAVCREERWKQPESQPAEMCDAARRVN